MQHGQLRLPLAGALPRASTHSNALTSKDRARLGEFNWTRGKPLRNAHNEKNQGHSDLQEDALTIAEAIEI